MIETWSTLIEPRSFAAPSILTQTVTPPVSGGAAIAAVARTTATAVEAITARKDVSVLTGVWKMRMATPSCPP